VEGVNGKISGLLGGSQEMGGASFRRGQTGQNEQEEQNENNEQQEAGREEVRRRKTSG